MIYRCHLFIYSWAGDMMHVRSKCTYSCNKVHFGICSLGKLRKTWDMATKMKLGEICHEEKCMECVMDGFLISSVDLYV